MMRGNSAYGRRQRTQEDKARDCYAFIVNARPAALLAVTPERLCDDKGVTNKQLRREVTVRLLAMQDRERRREA